MADFKITLEKTAPYELHYTYSIAGPHTSSDKVCLFVYNREKSFTASNPITAASGEGKFTVSNVGYYNVRIIRGSDTTHALARSEPVLIGPSVDVTAERKGENIVVTYTIHEDPDYPEELASQWWIGAYKAGTLSNGTYISYKKCIEKKSGEKIIFNISKDLRPTKNSRSFDFRFFFEGSTPHKYSGSATYEVMSRDSLSHMFSCSNEGNICASLTIYWERHDEAVGGWDWIGVYTSGEKGAEKFEKYLTDGIKDDNGCSGSICFDLTKWYANYIEKSAQTPKLEVCYFTGYPPISYRKVDDMTINIELK